MQKELEEPAKNSGRKWEGMGTFSYSVPLQIHRIGISSGGSHISLFPGYCDDQTDV